ncbi:MAG: hypothetical protein L6V93_00515 [Clostridiales bacterium]|nr:MAG: hypothetical protein L6V93_00515 [Clostridiales bacterium]
MLIEEIRKLTSENPAVLRFSDEYGDRYEIKALMDGVSGKTANVKIAYIVQKGRHRQAYKRLCSEII